MKKSFLALFLAATVMLFPGTLFSEMEVLCCRPMCDGCGTGDRVCEVLAPQMCKDLGGWPVEGCEHCYRF